MCVCGGWSVHAVLMYVVSVLIMVYTGRLLCACVHVYVYCALTCHLQL